jgi:hypothetical protein
MKYLKTFEEIVISGITFKYNVGDYPITSLKIISNDISISK